MRFVTWNVNSVRLRLEHLARVIDALDPDVLCLQEIKVHTDLFPALDIAALGYPHQAVNGIKGYNGVAILSRRPLTDIAVHRFDDKDDGRHIAATVAGLRVHNLYLPAGGEKPNPEINPKFAHKLRVYEELKAWTMNACPPDAPAVVLGDFNIAPLISDVWSHERLKNVVTHTPVERETLTDWQTTGQWIDVGRRFIPPPQRLFTWWSYRGGTWADADRGRRLDHIWATPVLDSRLGGFGVLEATRGWDRPSDHVPVYADIASL